MRFEAGWEIPENGLYECIDFKKYWETPDTYSFLIRYENELAEQLENFDIKFISPEEAKVLCEAITEELPEYFGLPEVNIHYQKAC